MANKSAEEKGILLFKHFVQFLELYGAENYGECFEVNWPKVFKFCNSYHLLDFREDLEEIVYSDNDEIFRDRCFKWIEDQILNGYPVFELFNLNDHLSSILRNEYRLSEIEKDKRYFNSMKCFKCKYFYDDPHYIGKDNFSHSFKTSKQNIKSGTGILHRTNCLKRKELLEESQKNRFDDSVKFTYKKFNGDTYDLRTWKLVPAEHKKCPYFELDENMTYEKFIEMYGELV